MNCSISYRHPKSNFINEKYMKNVPELDYFQVLIAVFVEFLEYSENCYYDCSMQQDPVLDAKYS